VRSDKLIIKKERKMKIIVGYDGSDAAKKALELAKKHAESFDGKIYVLRSMVGGSGERVEDIEDARNSLNVAIQSIEKDGIACEQHLLIRGMDPGEDIVQFAEDNDADEIIIGIIKKSKVEKLLLGSNAQYVILHAPCPVIAVK
jgi:nucleotide-binding universal stress UspA family protein